MSLFHSYLVHIPVYRNCNLLCSFSVVIGQTQLLFPLTMQICGPEVTASNLHFHQRFVANSDVEVLQFLPFQAISGQNLVSEADPKATEIKRNTLINPSKI